MTELTVPAIFTPAVQQRVYRRLLTAMAYAGRIEDLDPVIGDERAALAVLATLVDHAIGLADPQDLLKTDERRFLGTRDATPEEADFVLLDGRRPPPTGFEPRLGTIPCPDRSTTLVLEVGRLGAGEPLRLTGPGIADRLELRVDHLDQAWLAARTAWCVAFPLGVDLILCDAARIACLPRTTRIEKEV